MRSGAAAQLRVHGAAIASLLLFAALMIVLRGSGVLLPPQGRTLFDAAAGLAAGEGLQVRDGVVLARYPPLYALALAAFARAGVSPVTAAQCIGAAAFAGTLHAALGLAQAIGVRARIAAGFFVISLASNWVMARTALPDGLAAAAGLYALLGAARYAERPAWRPLLLASLGCAAAAAARYMALFTVLPVVTGALLLRAPAGRARARHAVAFCTVAIAPAAAWMLRNFVQTGYLLGMSRTAARVQESGGGFVDNLRALVQTLAIDLFGFGEMGTRHFVHDAATMAWPTGTLAAIGLFSCSLVAVTLAQRRALAAFLRPESAPALPRRFAARLLAAYCATHALALIVLWSIGNNDPLATRYVAPLYVPLALLGFGAFCTLRRTNAPAWQRTALALAGLCVLAPNLAKLPLLLSDPPSQRTMEVETWRLRRLQWRHGFEWGAAPAPSGPASRPAARPGARPAD